MLMVFLLPTISNVVSIIFLFRDNGIPVYNKEMFNYGTATYNEIR